MEIRLQKALAELREVVALIGFTPEVTQTVARRNSVDEVDLRLAYLRDDDEIDMDKCRNIEWRP